MDRRGTGPLVLSLRTSSSATWYRKLKHRCGRLYSLAIPKLYPETLENQTWSSKRPDNHHKLLLRRVGVVDGLKSPSILRPKMLIPRQSCPVCARNFEESEVLHNQYGTYLSDVSETHFNITSYTSFFNTTTINATMFRNYKPPRTARDGSRDLRKVLSNPEYSETGLPYNPLDEYHDPVKPQSAPSASPSTNRSWTPSSPQFTPRNTGVPYTDDRFFGRRDRSQSGGNRFRPHSKSMLFFYSVSEHESAAATATCLYVP